MQSFLSFLLGCIVGSILFAMHVDSELREQSCKFTEDKRVVLESKINCALINYKYEYKNLHNVEPPIDSIKNWITDQIHIYKDSLLLLTLSYNTENEHVYVCNLDSL